MLRVEVYRPDAPGPHPVILSHHPYGIVPVEIELPPSATLFEEGSQLRRSRRPQAPRWQPISAAVVDPVGVGGVHGLVVLGEQLGDQLAAAGDADLLEDGLEVAADGVR
jgi:hypothetical protein